MALPVANLGYMPGMNPPSSGGRYQQRNVWQDLAAQALGAVIAKGIDNSMSRDYTSQAQAEGLPVQGEPEPWWKKVVMGPRTDEKQLGAMRGESSATTRQVLSDKAAGKRGDAVQKGETERTNLNNKGAGERQSAALTAAATEGGLDRENQRTLQFMRSSAESNMLDKRIAAEEAMLGRKLTTEERVSMMQHVLRNAGSFVQDNAFRKAMLPPDMAAKVPSVEDQTTQYLQMLARMGYDVGALTAR